MFFTKMHGLGNNYILFNQLDASTHPSLELEYHELAKRVSDVHFGIGSDGIILICPSEIAHVKMRIFNKDGSEAKNCGNGLRCVARYVFDHEYIIYNHFTIETLSGVVSVEVKVDEKKEVQSIVINMGKPKLLKGLIPMRGDALETAINERYTIGKKNYFLTCLSMGNPHAVLFVENHEEICLEEIGPIIEHDSLFPERVNISVVQIKNKKEIIYRVWERGSQITMACGTGACASVVAATLNHLLEMHQPILVHLQGGDLLITWDELGDVWMQGEASYICQGMLDESFLEQ